MKQNILNFNGSNSISVERELEIGRGLYKEGSQEGEKW